MKKLKFTLLMMMILFFGLGLDIKGQGNKEGIVEDTNSIYKSYEDLLKPNNSLKLETRWVKITNRGWGQPYGKKGIQPWIELAAIEVEMTTKQKENFERIISTNYNFDEDKSISDEEAIKKLHEDLINSLGVAKYNSFIRWVSSFGIILEPPYRKKLVKNYERELKDIESARKLRKKRNILNDEDTIPFRRYKNEIENIFDILAGEMKLTKQQKEKVILKLLKYRLEKAKIENQIEYMEYAADNHVQLITEKEIEEYFNELFDKYRKIHEKEKKEIKGLLNLEQQKIFTEVFGWSL